MTDDRDWDDDRTAAGDLNAEDEADSDIQQILDIGYDQLDGFVAWVESVVGMDTRTAQQDCFNAEALVDYLANQHRKTALDVNEFELRWFMFSHYIRKALADRETEERLPDSLHRFFAYLRAEHAWQPPDWLPNVLEERDYYLKRRAEYHELNEADEREWQEGFQAWCEDLEYDLDARCLWLPRDMGDGLAWGDVMGWREATLQDEANHLWQAERAQLLYDGLDFESARQRLLEVYLLWTDTPQARLDGQTPREVILDERAERSGE